MGKLLRNVYSSNKDGGERLRNDDAVKRKEMAAVEAKVAEPAGQGNDQGEENRPGSAESWQSWSEYNFEWLFDPNRFDHLPIEEQLKLYKHRDLKKGKIYKFAAQIWGAPLSRKRKIVAPPMDTSGAKDTGPMELKTQPATSELKPQIPPVKKPSSAELRAKHEGDKVKSYHNWMAERKKFRSDLENMGLNEEWLARKPDKTALEHRVLRRLIEERDPKAPSPPPRIDTPLNGILPTESPTVMRPSPLAIRIIEKFLRKKKMRLVDLFRSVDKDKDWKLSRDEFTLAIHRAEIPISDVLLEDLILTLDTDLNNELDYRELAKGMGLWKIEKRETKKKTINSGTTSPNKYAQLHGLEPPDLDKDKLLDGSLLQKRSKSESGYMSERSSPLKMTHSSPSPTRIKSALSTISSASSQYLEPPESDLRSEQFILDNEEAMVDLRKRDRAALPRLLAAKPKVTSANAALPNSKDVPKKKTPTMTVTKSHGTGSSATSDTKSMIKTGDKAVDNHCTPSTMGGETGNLVDKFRQLKFKEYNEICQLCRENNVPFTEKLLTKVLLFPRDKSHRELRRQIRQPALHLISSGFAEPPKRSETPEVEEAPMKPGQIRLSKTGKILVDSRHAYPVKTSVVSKPVKMTLSTGKAVVHSHVNCWMTFEEYDGLTKHLANKYRTLHGRSDSNAFWPGHLLDKIRLCMPTSPPKVSAVYQTIQKTTPSNSGYNNNLNTWPVSDAGYVQFASIDK